MKQVWLVRVLLVVGLVAVFAAFALWPGGLSAATSGSGTYGRKDLFVALITLGVLGIALYGFDLREWL